MQTGIFRLLSTTALAVIGASSFAAGSLAQSGTPARTTLPNVTVDAPTPRRAAVAPRARATAARGASRANRRSATAPAPAAVAVPTPAVERADGPVIGNVATRSATGSKTNAAIIEIPQTVNVVTADQIRSQGALSVSEALRYTPGVTVEPYGASGLYDVFTLVRGFRADLYLDGSRLPKGVVDGLASAVVDPWMLERIEVLKGPASGLYGSSSPGGLINMVSKQPSATPIREVEIQGGSFGRVQGAFDIGGPIDAQKQFLYRVTGVVGRTDGQTDFANSDYYWISPSFTWRPDMDTKLTVSAHYKHDEGVWSFFNYLPAQGTVTPAANGQRFSTNLFTGEPSFDRRKFDQGWIGTNFEHRLNDSVVLTQNLRYSVSDFKVRAAATGRFDPDADGNLVRMPIDVATRTEAFTLDNRANLNFSTGLLQHDAAVGVDYLREDFDYKFNFSFDTTSLNPFAPIYGQAIANPNMVNYNYSAKLDQVGVYVQDRIKLGGWLLTLGGRFDSATSELNNRGTDFGDPGKASQSDSAFTGRAGLTYLFDNGVAPYVSYATSFQPEIGIDRINQVFKPSTGQQLEGGIKYQPAGSKTLLTAAVFDLTQQNRLTTDTDFNQRQVGEVNVRGAEFEAKTEIARNLDLIASYAYLEPYITQSANAAEIGFRLSTIPSHQASVWTNYLFDGGALAGLSLGGGVRYNGNTTDTLNVVAVPSYTLVDARIGYDFGYRSPALKGVRLALNATNLFDKTYVSQCDGSLMCTYGTRRKLLATLSYRW